jgi:hypothetical protein
MSDIVTPSAVGPISGFTSLKMGAHSTSVIGGPVAWCGGLALGGVELRPAFWGGGGKGTRGGEVEGLSSRD